MLVWCVQHHLKIICMLICISSSHNWTWNLICEMVTVEGKAWFFKKYSARYGSSFPCPKGTENILWWLVNFYNSNLIRVAPSNSPIKIPIWLWMSQKFCIPFVFWETETINEMPDCQTDQETEPHTWRSLDRRKEIIRHEWLETKSSHPNGRKAEMPTTFIEQFYSLQLDQEKELRPVVLEYLSNTFKDKPPVNILKAN